MNTQPGLDADELKFLALQASSRNLRDHALISSAVCISCAARSSMPGCACSAAIR